MALGTTLVSEVGARRGPTDVFLRVDYDGKPEDSCLGETIVVGSYGVSFGVSGKGYPLV